MPFRCPTQIMKKMRSLRVCCYSPSKSQGLQIPLKFFDQRYCKGKYGQPLTRYQSIRVLGDSRQAPKNAHEYRDRLRIVFTTGARTAMMTRTANVLVHYRWESYASYHLEQRPSLCSFSSSCEKHFHEWSTALGYANRYHSRQAKSLTSPGV